MDVVENGTPDRAPHRGLATGAAALVLLSGLGLVALRGDDPRLAPSAAPASKRPVAAVEPIPADADPYIPPLPPTPEPEPEPVVPDLDGPFVRERPEGTLLLALYNTLVSYDVRTQRRTPVTGAQPDDGDAIVRTVPLGGATAFLLAEQNYDLVTSDVGRVFVVRGTRATLVGRATMIGADGEDDGLWLQTYDARGSTLTNVDLAGRRTGARVRVDRQLVVERGLRGGSILMRHPQTGGVAEYGRDGRRLARRPYSSTVVTATPRYVVHADTGELCMPCDIVVRDVVTGRDTRLAGSPREAWSGELSPDGRLLAVTTAGNTGEHDLHMCDLTARACRRIAGSDYRIDENQELTMAWRGERLFVLASGYSPARLATWLPGWDGLHRIHGRVDAGWIAS